MACTSAPLCNQCAKTCSSQQHTKPKKSHATLIRRPRASLPPNGGGDAQARPHAHPSWPTSAFMLPGRKTRAPCRAAHCSRWSIASVWLGCKRSASSNTSFCARNVVARLRVCCPSPLPSLCSRTRKSFGRPTCAHALPAAHEHQPRRRPTRHFWGAPPAAASGRVSCGVRGSASGSTLQAAGPPLPRRPCPSRFPHTGTLPWRSNRVCFCPVPQHQQQCTHLSW